MLKTLGSRLLLSAFALSFAAASPALAGKPGSGGGGGGGTTPPVQYRLNYFAPPAGFTSFNAVWAMNESGAMVGDCDGTTGTSLHSGFLYDPAMDKTQAYDLNQLVEVPAGWYIKYAYGINDVGGVTAVIVKTNAADRSQPGYEAHGIVIDRREPTVNGKWIPHFLPDLTPSISFGREINNNGDVVGVFDQGAFLSTNQLGCYVYNCGLYRESGPDLAPLVLPANVSWTSVHINDSLPGFDLQVAGRTYERVAFRYSVTNDTLQTFPALSAYESAYGLPLVESENGFGEFCGQVKVRKSKGTQTVARPYRFSPDLEASPTLLGTESEHAGVNATDVNNSGDAVGYGTDVYLFHSSAGALNVDTLVSGTDAEKSTWINSRWGACKLTERVAVAEGSAGFPVIGTTNQSLGAVLVPTAP